MRGTVLRRWTIKAAKQGIRLYFPWIAAQRFEQFGEYTDAYWVKKAMSDDSYQRTNAVSVIMGKTNDGK